MNVLDASFEDIDLFSMAIISKFSEKISESNKTLIIGVASGGLPMAKSVYENYKVVSKNVDYYELKCQRPSTKSKETKLFNIDISRVLKKMPKPILNQLRVIEHTFLSKKRNSQREVIYKSELIFSTYDLIFVIDDAVDSGYSLKYVVDFIKDKAPKSDVISSVYVTTQEDPIYSPNYSHLENVLIRFPWSKDAKDNSY
ncbi:phosphoribosyltransferase family protein [Vibrio sp. 10N.286.52.B1]|uniref:phosphoribosyltransferase family protein n=1 Tax=Vibrio sp. 10N.286.52.B1 TaxID=3229712 RepID=UPI00354EBAF4